MPTYLADKSALVHMKDPGVAAKLAPLIMDGEIATCGVVELEVFFSARSERDLAATRAERAAAFPRIATSENDFLRAEDIITQLARRGHHRAVSLPDLVIAAAAERSQLVVLHYDGDYEVIAGVTGQRVEWVAPRRTL